MRNSSSLEDFGTTIEIDGISIPSQKPFFDDVLAIQDFKKRRLFLNDEIDATGTGILVDIILRYNEKDDEEDLAAGDRTPIRLYLTSVGGSVVDGLGLCDVIRHSVTPIYIIVISYAYSMALPVLLSGHKRFATPNASFLIHDGSSALLGSASKTEDTMDFMKRCDERVRDCILNNTNISAETLEQNRRKEWYLFADEAKELGIIDEIIGIDCSFDVLKR